jgi:soluble lytic murein transglycosylase
MTPAATSPAAGSASRRPRNGGRLLLVGLAAFLVAGGAGFWRARRPGVEPYRREVRRISRWRNVNPYLLEALILAASGGRADRVAPDGGTGLTGIAPETAALVAGKDGPGAVTTAELLEPQRNLELAAAALAALGARYDYDPYLTLAAFRAGPERVDALARKWTAADGEALVRHAAPAELRRFVLDVMAYWRLREGQARRE